MVISNEGIPLKTTLDNSTTVQVNGAEPDQLESVLSFVSGSAYFNLAGRQHYKD